MRVSIESAVAACGALGIAVITVLCLLGGFANHAAVANGGELTVSGADIAESPAIADTDSTRYVTFAPTPLEIRILGKGKFYVNGDGRLDFEGEATEAAQAFADEVVARYLCPCREGHREE